MGSCCYSDSKKELNMVSRAMGNTCVCAAPELMLRPKVLESVEITQLIWDSEIVSLVG